MPKTCSDCSFMLKEELQIFRCLKDSGKQGTKEVHPLYTACNRFKSKMYNFGHGFKSERLY
jgi:hypothetical protein